MPNMFNVLQPGSKQQVDVCKNELMKQFDFSDKKNKKGEDAFVYLSGRTKREKWDYNKATVTAFGCTNLKKTKHWYEEEVRRFKAEEILAKKNQDKLSDHISEAARNNQHLNASVKKNVQKVLLGDSIKLPPSNSEVHTHLSKMPSKDEKDMQDLLNKLMSMNRDDALKHITNMIHREIKLGNKALGQSGGGFGGLSDTQIGKLWLGVVAGGVALTGNTLNLVKAIWALLKGIFFASQYLPRLMGPSASVGSYMKESVKVWLKNKVIDGANFATTNFVHERMYHASLWKPWKLFRIISVAILYLGLYPICKGFYGKNQKKTQLCYGSSMFLLTSLELVLWLASVISSGGATAYVAFMGLWSTATLGSTVMHLYNLYKTSGESKQPISNSSNNVLESNKRSSVSRKSSRGSRKSSRGSRKASRGSRKASRGSNNSGLGNNV